MNILVTGGAGYIGSHTCVELLEAGHTVVIADNLCNSKVEAVGKVEQITNKKVIFHQVDVKDESLINSIFGNSKIDGILHCAGLKAVGESVSNPLEYYDNNLLCTIVLSKMCIKYGVKKFVFSSSATVYGEQLSPLREDMKLGETTNPYGETKAMSERILIDTAKANKGFAVSLLRYFNPIGAHKSGLLGEDPNGIPNNLMPFIAKVAKGQLQKLKIFGNDYDTIDGTGIRDYIHVVDLAKGHVKAIENLGSGVHVYNLGTGKGTSVLELVNAFMRVNNVDIPFEIVERRPGDIAVSFADASKAEQEMGWKAELRIEDMVRDAWNFEQRNG